MLGGLLPSLNLIGGVLNSNSISSIDKKIAEGSALRRQGKFVLAKTTFEEAHELAKERKDLNSQASCLINIGALSWNLGQVKESIGYYEEALGICKELGLRDEEKVCLSAIQIYKLYSRGKELRDQRRPEDSVRYFKEAVALAKKINSLEHELKCLRQMSLNYPQDHSEFYKLNNQALNIARKINHRLEEGRCLNNIGLYYWRSTRFSEALALLNEALAIIRENHRGGRDESDLLNNLSVIYADLGDYENSLKYIRRALEIDLFLRDENNISQGLNNLARIIRIINHSQVDSDPSSYYKESIELARKSGNYFIEICSLNNMGVLYQHKKDFAKSIEFLEAALQICQRQGIFDELCNIYANLGNAHIELNNIEKAKEYFDRSLDLALSAGRNDVLWEVYSGLGKCMENKNQPDLALTYYRLAVDVIDSIRGNLALDFHKAGFFRDKFKVYESCLNLLFRMMREKPSHQFDEAFFHIVEKAKARTLIEELIENASNEKPASTLLQEKLAEISREISLVLSELTRADLSQKAGQKIWEKLAEKEEEYAVLLNRAKLERKDKAASSSFDIISLKAAREDVLDEETALVEFFLGENQSYAFLVTRKDFFLKNLPGRAAIEDSLRAYLKIISSPPDKELDFIRAAQRIYQELLFPLEKCFSPSIKHLIIIPDGVLYYLPFETLIPGQNEKGRESNYLIEYCNISYAPSVSSLAFLIKKGTTDGHSKLVLALGNPDYSLRKANNKKKKDFNNHEEVLREFYLNLGFNFSNLPFSKKEVKQVSRFFPKDKIDIYTYKEAKEEILKTRRLTDYQILHFACHAFLDEKTPYRSALVLAFDDDPEEDGFLQGWEIQNLKLNASLAILSACQTGKGKLEYGEGVFGLQRVFFYAGARSTISTLWKVADKATSIFMYHFYYFLARGKNKAEALRLAKIKMLQSKFSHPFFWAGFILHGDYQHRLIHD